MHQIGASGQNRSMVIINESGLYNLILSSKLPSAKKFKRWVTSEVLPTIRKTGGYISDSEKIVNTYFGNISEPQRLIVKELFSQIEAQQKIIIEKDNKINELAPKASYYDLVLQCPDLTPITTIAQDYGMTAQKMNNLLHEKGVQYKQGSMWRLYAKYLDNGYTDITTYHATDFYGGKHKYDSMQWTQKGRLFIYNLLKEEGIVPEMERIQNKVS